LFKSNAKIHWIWMLDLDTLIMNFNITLESIADKSYDMIISEDCQGLNSGSVLFRNTQWTLEFLESVYQTNDKHFVHDVEDLWEQAAINYLYKRYKETYEKNNRIKVVHQKTFNSFPEETTKTPRCRPGRYEENDFLVHFAGATNKEEIFDRYYEALYQPKKEP